MTIAPARSLSGRVTVPGDKSISHRALLFSALADGTSHLSNLGPGDDCRSTRGCLARLGVRIDDEGTVAGSLRIEGCGVGGLNPPETGLDAGNSGTTTRLLLGILAGHPWEARVSGDASLSRRPMRRVIEPLTRMGARLTSTDGCLPLTIHGGRLQAIDYTTPVASAQVKSCVMLAGLHAEGTTIVREPSPTRDHTERALRQYGAEVRVDAGGAIHVAGGQRLRPVTLRVPGDPSSAAFWAAAATAMPGADITIDGVSLNPTRLGFLEALRRAGADITITPEGDAPEPVGSLRVRHNGLRPIVIEPEEVPGLIDELPVLAAMATFGGALSVSGAQELRVKESDRITELVRGLRALGATADERPDGFVIDGTRPLAGGTADAADDHRLAMAFSIAALGGRAPSQIHGAAVVSVSYPRFFADLEGLRA
jgi:3-phosphoshikimate 1-carboxyvinyltransferase